MTNSRATPSPPADEPQAVDPPAGPDADPYSGYAQLRARAEVHLLAEPTGLRRHTVVHHEHARRLLADPRVSKDPRNAWTALLRAGYVSGDPESDQYIFHIANCDPPDHTRLRKLVQQALTTARVARLRPFTERLADELLDGLLHAPPAAGAADLVADFALPLATRVTAELLGVPADDLDDYHLWSASMLIPPGTPGAPMPRAEAYRRIRDFFARLLAVRRAQPPAPGEAAPPDLLSALLAARDGSDRLSEEELVALVIFMLNTGQEPTVHLVCNGVLALLRHPDQLRLLREDPGLLDNAIEEFLRYDAPVAVSSLRIATEDIEVGESVIPAGGVVSVLFGSANRDGARFENPDRLDITRQDTAHLAFGHGIHRCVGAPLGRMIARTGLETLLRRCSGIALGCPPDALRWRPARVMRALESLPVRLTAAPAGPSPHTAHTAQS